LRVTYSKFADFNIVNSENLFLLSHSQFQNWNELSEEVEGCKNDAGTEEGEGGSGDGIRKLVGKLNPMVIEPPTRDMVDAIKMGNVIANSWLVRSLLQVSVALTQRRTQSGCCQ
jgi:hypothetical protein